MSRFFPTPLENNVALTNKINTALIAVITSKNIIADIPSFMGSEDFHHLVIGNNNTVYDYIKVGIANPSAYAKAIQEGKKLPFFIMLVITKLTLGVFH